MKGKQKGDWRLRHTMPGRIRIKLGSRIPASRLDKIRAELDAADGFTHVDVRPTSRSVVVAYDPRRTDERSALRALDNAVVRSAPRPKVIPLKRSRKVENAACRSEPRSLRWSAVKVLGLTGFMTYHAVRTFAFSAPTGRLALSVAAGLGALPLIRSAVRDLLNRRILTINTFLSNAVVLGIATGDPLTALEVVWIRETGSLLEEFVEERSARGVRQIVEASSRDAIVLAAGSEIETPLDKLTLGDRVVVRPTERIPVDGLVLEGEALVNEAHITGRPEPERRTEGDKVFAGTIVHEGLIHIRADKVGEETYIAQVARLVEQSLANRSPIEKQTDILAARLTRYGLLAVGVTFLVTGNLARTISVYLLMCCPCATVLAASTAVTAALANAAAGGVLIKGGKYLEKFAEVDCLCFDKTGTLTEGAPAVTAVLTRTPTLREERVVAMAAAAELRNQHPLARAIVDYAERAGIAPARHAVAQVLAGHGVRALLDEDEILVGNADLMEEEGVDIRYFGKKVQSISEEGLTAVYVARNGKPQGVIVIGYSFGSELARTFDAFRSDGIEEIHVITGDISNAADNLKESLRLDGYGGGLLPQQKADYIANLEDAGRVVAMVGDGVNDAPAFAGATVGVAVGAGSAEAALETADIALADGDLSRLLYVRALSRDTLRIIRQNHQLAVFTDFLGAAATVAGRLSPLLGGTVHMAHSVGIFLNSSRLLRRRPDITAPRSES